MTAKDEVQEASEGPKLTMPDTDTTPEIEADDTLELEGFSEAMLGVVDPQAEAGEPEQAEAADASEGEANPDDGEVDTSDHEDPGSADDADEDEDAEPEVTISFDGFSDESKTTYERLYKDGHMTAEEVERSRKESMFQSAFTKKTMALAEKVKAFESEKEALKEDIALLERIRSDDRLHAKWVRLSRDDGDDPETDTGDDELMDRRGVEKLLDERHKRREAERLARTRQEQDAYEKRQGAMQEMIQDTMLELSIEPEQMKTYLEAEEAKLAVGQDPILVLDPAVLRERVTHAHEIATLKAENARLSDRLTKKTSKAVRTAKQSQPPSRPVSSKGEMSLLEQTEADLGVDPDWSNVVGFGNR